jgi:hypothetical protein
MAAALRGWDDCRPPADPATDPQSEVVVHLENQGELRSIASLPAYLTAMETFLSNIQTARRK